ncbi:MAG: hypothetical protein ACMXYG_06330 [Candidatus Woesearchaeota archaeon]
MLKFENLRQRPVYKEYIEFSIDGFSYMVPRSLQFRYSDRQGFLDVNIFQVMQHRDIPEFFGNSRLEVLVAGVPLNEREDFFDYYHSNPKKTVEVDILCHADLFIIKNCRNPNEYLFFFPDSKNNIFITPYSTLNDLDRFHHCELFYLADNFGDNLIVNRIGNDLETRDYLIKELKYYLTHSPNSKVKRDSWLNFDDMWN